MNEGGQGGCLYEWMERWKIDGTSPPLLLHAGGGGGAGDMPCLPHLDQRGELEILMTHGDREKIILQQENLLFN